MKQTYSFYETVLNIKNVILTKLFWKNARLIRYPFFMRGKNLLEYGNGLTVGYFCRFEAYSLQNDLEEKKIIIGSKCKFGDRVHISSCSEIKIGDHCLFASNILVTDNEHGNYTMRNQDSPGTPPDERPIKTTPVHIDDNCWIGENTVILPGTRIGKGSIIGANSVVKGEYPDFSMIVGAPAKVVKQYSFETQQWERV
ncbi:TPA: DapH/DapD/GlmU-related protein [Streptococcus suis]